MYVRAGAQALFQAKWPGKALLRSKGHNWGTQIGVTTQENLDVSLYTER